MVYRTDADFGLPVLIPVDIRQDMTLGPDGKTFNPPPLAPVSETREPLPQMSYLKALSDPNAQIEELKKIFRKQYGKEISQAEAESAMARVYEALQAIPGALSGMLRAEAEKAAQERLADRTSAYYAGSSGRRAP